MEAQRDKVVCPKPPSLLQANLGLKPVSQIQSCAFLLATGMEALDFVFKSCLMTRF